MSGAERDLPKTMAYLLADLLDWTDRHRISYSQHEHDCYEEWAVIRDSARNALRDFEDATSQALSGVAASADDTPSLDRAIGPETATGERRTR